MDPESENLEPEAPTPGQPEDPTLQASPSESVVNRPWFERPALRGGLNLLAGILVVCALVLTWQRLVGGKSQPQSQNQSGSGGVLASSVGANAQVSLAPFSTSLDLLGDGILRHSSMQTIIPNRPRVTVITYTVEMGDNLTTIAKNFGLDPKSVLWGNYELLKDNPEVLQVKQTLNILPVDGAYYKWKDGDTLSGVAGTFKVKPEEIINYPGNHLDLTATISGTAGIEPGAWVIIPGGKRPFKDWGPPAISRTNPAVARYYGPGSCGAVYQGPIGSGSFIWPTTAHFISGYTYSDIHPAIDIGGVLGNAVYAADSGVVVYAGWSNYGYGNLIVIDHGNGWQTAYAHLNAIGVICGQGVSKGVMIGALGTTGNSSGPHLHFEMSFNGAKPNPLDYVTP